MDNIKWAKQQLQYSVEHDLKDTGFWRGYICALEGNYKDKWDELKLEIQERNGINKFDTVLELMEKMESV